MIQDFKIDISKKLISWKNNNKDITIDFNSKVFQAIEIKFLDQVLIIADYREVGEKNMFIYDSMGKCISNPDVSKEQYYGFYSIWYIEGNIEQDVILISKSDVNYEVKCKLNLESYILTNFSLTK
ncbi:hypothetical protein O2K51_00760 [Apibacter raozihei]|uniref:hypothetical protein n=1 Tax=Apibacter raozihei TaxID=2500547 RepID=UPI000FE35A74|nr:hypothetical protein [Apibacter raozihei]